MLRGAFNPYLLGLLAVVLVVSPAWGHETDQFSVPTGRQHADMRHYFSGRVYEIVQRAVEKTNARIERSLVDGQPTAETERLQNPDTLAWAVLYEFPPVINYIERMELTLRSAEIRDQYPGKLTLYQPTFWIYSHWALILDPTKLVRLARCSTVMIDGVYLGTDKIAHFVHMGYIYFAEFRRALAAGYDEAEATRRAIALGTGGNPLFSENTLLGLLATGVVSNADLAANYLGFKFFRNLTEPVMLRGRTQKPMLVRQGAYWRFAPQVNPNSDFFVAFISDHWNEALNPNVYGTGIAACVRQELKKRCPSVVAWYVDEQGKPRTREQFAAMGKSLETYHGEDYGFQREPDSMVTIAETCFAEESTPTNTPAGTEASLAAEFAKGAAVDAPDALGRTPLWWAAAAGRHDEVKKLIAGQADVHAADVDGETALHAAARRGHTPVVKALLEAGAKVNATSRHGATALHLAARSLHGDVMRLLLANRANVWQRDEFGITALHEVAGRGDLGLVQLLIAFGADPRVADDGGTTPLHRAARAGHEAMVRLLRAAGADAAAANAIGRTPLDEARLGGHLETAQRLEAELR